MSNWPLFRDFHGENCEDFHLESNGCLDISSSHQLFLPANQRRYLTVSAVAFLVFSSQYFKSFQLTGMDLREETPVASFPISAGKYEV